MKQTEKFGWTVLPHPSYSPDVAPSDFHLFRPINDGLWGQNFSDDAIIAAVRKSVTSTGANFYECSMQAFFHHWQKCIP
jgi:histone-lysine N-methyltransferase SETMAR